MPTESTGINLKEINERIKTAEKKLVAALKKRVSSIDFDFIIKLENEETSLEDKIDELTEAATKADKTIETRDTKATSDDVLSRVYESIRETYKVPENETKTDEQSKPKKTEQNPYKKKVKYKSQNLTQYSKKEQKLIGEIYGIIKAILPHDMAETVVNKIQEELSK